MEVPLDFGGILEEKRYNLTIPVKITRTKLGRQTLSRMGRVDMANSVVQIDLSDQAVDFRRQALQPGMGLLDKSGAHAAVLRNWLGGYLADPHWEGSVVKYQIRTDDNQRSRPRVFNP